MEYNVNKFKELLLDENLRHNLVSRKSLTEELDKHIEDSLKILDYVDLDGKMVVDIGSGAGFPGLILALACPRGKFTLVESDLKKSMFLQSVIEQMKLENVTVKRQRIEELGQDENYRGSFDICTCRALAVMRVVLEYAIPLLQTGGTVMLWKGKNYLKEIEESGEALKVLGGSMIDSYVYTLMDDLDRVIVAVKKVQETPAKYPRRVGIPLKRPL